jgi:SNF2 family DNA or RNA helicase
MYHQTLLRSGQARFDRVVLDEGHAIRNGFKTARGLACLKIAWFASCRWILSATPVQNGFKDWINLCMWLRCACKRSELAEAAGVLMLRRTMAELRLEGGLSAADLPPSPVFVVRDLSIPDTPVDKGIDSEYRYFHVLCDQLDDVLDNRRVSALVKLELWMRIQQFLVHPQVYIDGKRESLGPRLFPRGDWTGGATKWTACVLGDLAAAVADKVGTIVFCQFRKEMDMVCAAAEEMGAAVWSIRGGMSVAEVGAAVAEGRVAVEEGRPVVMVVQIVSGGVGLNLQFCQRVLFLSQHWNPAVVHQAVGRAVRIGQKEVVRVYMYRIVDDVMDNLDLRMSAVHAGKIGVAQELCSSFYEGFGGPAAEMLTTDAETASTPSVPNEEDPSGFSD